MLALNQKTIAWAVITISAALLLVLIFTKTGVDKEGEFLCKAVADSPDLEMEDCPAHNDQLSWLLVVAFGIAFIMLAAGAYLYFVPITKAGAAPAKKVDISKFDDDEKKIYEILKAHDGSVYQSDLIKETEFSKVKITRVLDKMETKGIVDRQRRGMTNIVVLK